MKVWVHGRHWSLEMTSKEARGDTYWLDWRAVEIIGTSLDGSTRYYGELNDMHEDPSKAETAVEGYTKWDGCTEFGFPNDRPHFCGLDSALAHMKELLELVHQAAIQLSEPYECQSGKDMGHD